VRKKARYSLDALLANVTPENPHGEIDMGRPVRAPSMHGRSATMRRKLPRLRSDKAAERFVETADLTDYDLSRMTRVRFEFQPNTERITMRVPAALLKAVRSAARREGIPYQRFIRQVLETAVGEGGKPG
jgi:predicted DNA binding CopG/RHH family protein